MQTQNGLRWREASVVPGNSARKYSAKRLSAEIVWW